MARSMSSRGSERLQKDLSSPHRSAGTSCRIHWRKPHPDVAMEMRCTDCLQPGETHSLCALCNKRLCLRCADLHQHAGRSSHTPLGPEECATDSSCWPNGSPTCPVHTQEPLELLCETCDLLSCSRCHLSSHKDHRLVHVGTALRDQQWLLENITAQVEDRRAAVENLAKQIESRIHNTKIQQRKVENQIKMAKMILINELNKRVNLLTEQLKRISGELRLNLEEQLRGLVEMCSQLGRMQSFTAWATAQQARNPLLFSRELITYQTQHLLDSQKPAEAGLPVKIKFNWDASFWTKQISTLGQLTAEGGNVPRAAGVSCHSLLPKPHPITCPALPASVCHRALGQTCGFPTCFQPVCCSRCPDPHSVIQLEHSRSHCCSSGPFLEGKQVDGDSSQRSLCGARCAGPGRSPSVLRYGGMQGVWEVRGLQVEKRTQQGTPADLQPVVRWGGGGDPATGTTEVERPTHSSSRETSAPVWESRPASQCSPCETATSGPSGPQLNLAPTTTAAAAAACGESDSSARQVSTPHVRDEKQPAPGEARGPAERGMCAPPSTSYKSEPDNVYGCEESGGSASRAADSAQCHLRTDGQTDEQADGECNEASSVCRQKLKDQTTSPLRQREPPEGAVVPDVGGNTAAEELQVQEEPTRQGEVHVANPEQIPLSSPSTRVPLPVASSHLDSDSGPEPCSETEPDVQSDPDLESEEDLESRRHPESDPNPSSAPQADEDAAETQLGVQSEGELSIQEDLASSPGGGHSQAGEDMDGPSEDSESGERTAGGTQPEEMENEDFCAVCRNGGDLLCCDRCPKVFHLSCHVPPLLSFPTGDWVCTLCRSVLQPEVEYDCENARAVSHCKGKPAQRALSECDLRKCEKLTLTISCNILSAPFHEPVSPLAQHYYQIIKKPMDLSVIRRKLLRRSSHHYHSPEEFVADVYLMFRNCAKFNYADSEVAQAGRSLEAFFSAQLRQMYPNRAFLALPGDDSDSEEYEELPGFPWPNGRKRKRRPSLSGRRHHF